MGWAQRDAEAKTPDCRASGGAGPQEGGAVLENRQGREQTQGCGSGKDEVTPGLLRKPQGSIWGEASGRHAERQELSGRSECEVHPAGFGSEPKKGLGAPDAAYEGN